MATSEKFCWKLFSGMLKISAFTFGGGYVIIPLIRKAFVEKHGWLSEEEMVDMVAIAQSSPGAVAVNVAAQLGFRIAQTRGMLAAVAGTLLPPFLWLSIISLCYDAFRTSPVVDAFLRSMQPAVAAVILSAAISMLRSLKSKKKPATWILLTGALALSYAGMKAIYILLLGACAGALLSFWEVKRHAA